MPADVTEETADVTEETADVTEETDDVTEEGPVSRPSMDAEGRSGPAAEESASSLPGPVVILQHEVESFPATVACVLEADGVPYTVRHVYGDDGVPALGELESIAGLIPLGGGMNSDDDRYAWLAGERLLLREAVVRDTPVLGICLGAQQLAAATGGRVYHRGHAERGWLPVEVTGEDRLFAGLPRRFWTLQWHGDSFEAPPRAAVFAERGGGQQAFRIGRRAWGVQFHPEVDDALVEHWLADAERADPAFGSELREKRAAIIVGSVPLCTTIVRNFLRSL
jgi:GMP synthase (glutamine-hydrolysing)